MNYEIQIMSWGKMFSVPCNVVEDYINKASGEFVKVLLCVLCRNNNKFSSQEIAKQTSLNLKIVEDALEFWISNDIINKKQNVNIPENQTNIQSIVAEDITKKLSVKKTSVKYSPKDIENKVKNSSDLKFLMDNIQVTLKRTISQTEQAAIINLHEYYGFSVGIIIMLYDYCQQIGKTNPGYVDSIAKSWFENNITTHEAVEKEIIRLIDFNTYENRVCKSFGIESRLSQSNKKIVETWSQNNYSIDIINLAYDKSLDHTNNKLSFAYINKILSNWDKDGLKTITDIENFIINNKEKIKSGSQNQSSSSFDLNEFYNFALNNTPDVKGEI